MGIDINSAQLLMQSRRRGVCFDQVATLGRQNLYARRDELISLLHANGWTLDQQSKEKLRDTSLKHADEFLRILGAKKIVAIDASDYEGAELIHDLNLPFEDHDVRTFDVVFDGGSLEHVFNFPVAIANAMRLVRRGGHYIGATPANNFFGHGFYQFSAELYYRIFSPPNGFETERMIIWEEREGSQYYEISDPETVRSRVEFLTRQPANLYVQAKKTDDVQPFTAYPQQSDYRAAWHDKSADIAPAEAQLPDTWPFRLRSMARQYGLSKLVTALPIARYLHSWAFRTGRLDQNLRGYWKPISGLKVQRFSSTKWLN